MDTLTEPVAVSDSFIIQKVIDCLEEKTSTAFGESRSNWGALVDDVLYRQRFKITAALLKGDVPAYMKGDAQFAVLGRARELIDMAYAHGWTDELKDWGVWQIENKEYSNDNEDTGH